MTEFRFKPSRAYLAYYFCNRLPTLDDRNAKELNASHGIFSSARIHVLPQLYYPSQVHALMAHMFPLCFLALCLASILSPEYVVRRNILKNALKTKTVESNLEYSTWTILCHCSSFSRAESACLSEARGKSCSKATQASRVP